MSRPAKRRVPQRRNTQRITRPEVSRRKPRRMPGWRTLEWLESRRVLAAPTLAAISDVTLFAGAPLHIALDGFDADGDSLSFSATSSNPVLQMTIPQGNRSLRISVVHAASSDPDDMAINGDMIFELFEDLAPTTTARIIELAEQGFYNGLTFHRIANLQDGSPFVIQGGDPAGDGTGGSGVEFDDEFNKVLQHTSADVLSMAKGAEDTNDSQFFVTGQATRFLDFQHSIFGFLNQGSDVRQAIQSLPTGDNDRPLSPVFMQSVQVFVDEENGVLRLNAPEGTSGTASVTVTASDGNGGTVQRTFQVTIQPDPVNSRPFLSNVPSTIEVTPGGTTSVALQGTDVEGGPIQFGLTNGQPTGFSVFPGSTSVTPVNQVATANFTVNATTAPVGVYSISFFVVAGDQNPTGVADADIQVVPLLVTGIDLLSDSGSSSTDNVTNLNNTSGKTLDFRVIGVSPDATIILKSGSTIIGQGTGGTDRTATITTNGTAPLADGQHTIRAFVVNGGVETEILQPLTITVNTASPVFTSSPPTTAFSGSPYSYNAQTTQEGSGVVYSLVTRPTGMTINASTGQVSWTPTAGQPNDNPVVIRATNAAGNIIEQAFDIFVLVPPQLAIGGVPTTVTEGGVFEFSIAQFVADENLPNDSFTFSLAPGAPAGATINASTGLFRWVTTEADGPSQVPITFRVADASGLTGSQTLTLSVLEQNTPPVLAPIADRTVDEHRVVSFQVTATDSDLPAQSLTFSLAGGAPAGATIDPNTGVFRWIPSEAQGPGTFNVTVRVADGNGGVDLESFTIIVREVNDTPILEPIADQFTIPGGVVTFVAVGADPDIPGQEVRFSLEDDAPEGATIDPLTGEFRWETADDEELRELFLTIRLTEVSDEALFTTRLVRVVVGQLTDAVFPGGPNQFASGTQFDPTTDSDVTLTLSQSGLLPATPGSTAVGSPTTEATILVGAPNFTRGPETGVPHLVRPNELPPREEEDTDEEQEENQAPASQRTQTRRDDQPVGQRDAGADEELAAALIQAAQDHAHDAAWEVSDEPVADDQHQPDALPAQVRAASTIAPVSHQDDDHSRAKAKHPVAGAVLPFLLAPAMSQKGDKRSSSRGATRRRNR